MARRTTSSESGFTLAGLVVILTIMAIIVAYTVPPQWSKIMQRERDKQTIFVMKQYARAIAEWQRKHNSLPVSLEQMKEARLPRMIRGIEGELLCPLTGKADWILIPPTAVTGGQLPQAQGGGGANPGQVTNPGLAVNPPQGGPQQPPMPSTTFNPAASPPDYKGPFIGVRPRHSGESFLELNGATSYDKWAYTTFDLQIEVALRTRPSMWK